MSQLQGTNVDAGFGYMSPNILGGLLRSKEGNIMKKVQVLGTGCRKCIKLTENAEKAAKVLGLECEIEKIIDINQILKFGVMMTPALVVDGKVRITGKVASVEEIKQILV
jgi:small redox-active disulfide protein 2